MTKIEEKSLNTQIKLYDEVLSHDRMIMSLMMGQAKDVKKIINSNIDSNGSLTLNNEELQNLCREINKITSDDDIKNINTWIESKHLEPRKTKIEILNLLK